MEYGRWQAVVDVDDRRRYGTAACLLWTLVGAGDGWECVRWALQIAQPSVSPM